MVHEIGNRTYLVADVEPLDLDGVRTVQVGTALWAIAVILLLLVLPVMVVNIRRLRRESRR